MNRMLFLWLAFWVGPSFGEEGLAAEVRMLNGDVFAGSFRAFENGYVHFLPEWGGEVLRFHAAYMGEIQLPGRGRRGWTPPSSRLRFVNGDRLSGHLLSMTEDEVTVESMWGQRLVADRAFVASVEMLPGEDDLIFRGLSPLSDWNLLVPGSRGARDIEEAEHEWFFPGDSRISRNLPFPDQGGVLLEMEISFPTGMTSATLSVFQSQGGGRGGRVSEGMVLTLNPSWMHVRTMDGNGRQIWVLREPFIPEMAEGRILVSIHLDLKTSEVTLRMNGQEYPSFYLQTEGPLSGREDMEMVLQPGRESGGLVLHYAGFTRFRGGYSVEAEREAEREEAGRDRVVFMNGDRMVAKVAGVAGASLRLILDDGGEVNVPRSRIRAVFLGTKASAHPRRRARDVGVALAERGDRLTLALARFDPEGLGGSSDIWKKAPVIPPQEVRGVRFNPYQVHRLEDGKHRRTLFWFER